MHIWIVFILTEHHTDKMWSPSQTTAHILYIIVWMILFCSAYFSLNKQFLMIWKTFVHFTHHNKADGLVSANDCAAATAEQLARVNAFYCRSRLHVNLNDKFCIFQKSVSTKRMFYSFLFDTSCNSQSKNQLLKTTANIHCDKGHRMSTGLMAYLEELEPAASSI